MPRHEGRHGDGGPVRWMYYLGLRRPRPEDSVAWEVQHHIDEIVDRLREEGWDEEDARAEAMRRFGDPARYRQSMTRIEKERASVERRVEWGELLRQALTGVLRTAVRYPGYTLGVVLTLALGIGANSTMYGVVDRVLLQPPAHVVDAGRVRRVFMKAPDFLNRQRIVPRAVLSYPDYEDLKLHAGLSVAAYTVPRVETVEADGEPSRATVSLAAAEFFPLLGVRPVLGRFFSAEDVAPRAQLTAVLSQEYWERTHGSDPAVLGSTIELSGRTHTIVGVAPKGFTGVGLQAVDLWLPLEPTYLASAEEDFDCMHSRGCMWLRVVARLGEGVGVSAAEAEATRLHLNGRREMIDAGEWREDGGIILSSMITAESPDAPAEARVVRWLMGVSLVVLLIACANVANLFLARGTRRSREVAIRLALGAERRRVVATTVLEAVVLAFLGGAAGLVLATWGGGIVRGVLLPGVYFPDSALNLRVILFTLLASVMAGLMASVGPAIQAGRAEVTGGLVDVSRRTTVRRSALRGILTVSQAALSVVLLVGAGLLIRSLGEIHHLDLGFDLDRVLVATLELRNAELDSEAQKSLYAEAAAMVERLPSVESSVSTALPFQGIMTVPIAVPHLDSIPHLSGGGPFYFPVASGYFETVGLRVLRGRGFEQTDGPDDRRVAVVSETMARTLWPGEEAIGRCLLVGRDSEECTSVVGVVEDASIGGFQDEQSMVWYMPLAQSRQPARGLYIRSTGRREATLSAAARALRTFSPEVRFASVVSLEEMLDPEARSWKLGATMFSLFGLLATALAAIGLYGVLAFDVAQRTRELGVRAALGADRNRLLGGVLLQGGRIAALGILIGTALALVAAPFASGLLFQTSPRDPVVFAAVTVVLGCVGIAAAFVPGLRATRVDPVISLRVE